MNIKKINKALAQSHSSIELLWIGFLLGVLLMSLVMVFAE